MSELDSAAGDLAVIFGALGQTFTYDGSDPVPCSFTNTGSLSLGLFMEQDVESGKLLARTADLPTPAPAAGTIIIAPDGNSYRIKTVQADNLNLSILYTLEDLTGKV